MQNFQVPDLVALYSQPYDARELAWREIGARAKAAEIDILTRPVRGEIASVLEVGCGTGAVLEKVAALHIGCAFTGLEISQERVGMAKAQNGVALRIEPYDGKTIPFPDESFDLVYATHVLEHVVEPRSFLHELRRVARHYVLIEVPCEITARASHAAMQTALDIGHINTYNPMSLALMLETSGLVVREMHVLDAGYATHAFGNNPVKAAVKVALRWGALALGQNFASSLFSYRCAALCEKGARLNIA